MSKLNIAATIPAYLFFVTAAEPAYAIEQECTAGAPYQGADLRTPLDLSLVPNNRPISFDSMPEETVRELDENFDRLFDRAGASAATISIWKPGLGYWTRTSGIADSGSESFWWASTGKMVTATIILQLISEGRLTSDQQVAEFFPEFEHSSTATVDDLLHHTSGIFSFNADLRLRERTGYKSPDELIAVADSHQLDFCPGTNWNYSNTGYVMLARIAEQIEGESFPDIVERRIAEPLGLETLRVLQPDDPTSAMVPLASDEADGVEEIASVFGAGGVVSNSADMLAFLHAYLEDGLVAPAARNDAVSLLFPMFGTTMSYGTGIMVTDVPDADVPTIWVGHSGGSPHAKGLLVYDVERDTYLAIAFNSQVPAEAVANNLLRLFD